MLCWIVGTWKERTQVSSAESSAKNAAVRNGPPANRPPAGGMARRRVRLGIRQKAARNSYC
eukprot:579910-Rhodomonas_salina.1